MPATSPTRRPRRGSRQTGFDIPTFVYILRERCIVRNIAWQSTDPCCQSLAEAHKRDFRSSRAGPCGHATKVGFGRSKSELRSSGCGGRNRERPPEVVRALPDHPLPSRLDMLVDYICRSTVAGSHRLANGPCKWSLHRVLALAACLANPVAAILKL